MQAEDSPGIHLVSPATHGHWRQRFGLAGERLAERYLLNQGCELLHRRYRRRGGEIDLVVRDGDTVVFVEVKSRQSRSYGEACEAVGASKRRRLVATARVFLQEAALGSHDCRFDVVSIQLESGRVALEWTRDAFRP